MRRGPFGGLRQPVVARVAVEEQEHVEMRRGPFGGLRRLLPEVRPAVVGQGGNEARTLRGIETLQQVRCVSSQLPLVEMRRGPFGGLRQRADDGDLALHGNKWK